MNRGNFFPRTAMHITEMNNRQTYMRNVKSSTSRNKPSFSPGNCKTSSNYFFQEILCVLSIFNSTAKRRLSHSQFVSSINIFPQYCPLSCYGAACCFNRTEMTSLQFIPIANEGKHQLNRNRALQQFPLKTKRIRLRLLIFTTYFNRCLPICALQLVCSG